jgi:signal peptidase II
MRKLFASRFLRITLFCFSSVSLISWDRVTKDMAKEHLKDKASYSYFHDSFRLTYVENTGAMMSLGDGISKTASFWLFSILPLCFLGGFLVYILKKSNRISYKKLLIFSLIFAGGIGNIMDRIWFDRHVSDFMNIGWGNIRTGIFNFADVWITTGIICLFLFGRYIDQKPTAGI